MSSSLPDLGDTLNHLFKISERRAAIKTLAEIIAPALAPSVRVGTVVKIQPAGLRVFPPQRIVEIENGKVVVRADGSANATIHDAASFPTEWAEGLLREALSAAHERKTEVYRAAERAEAERVAAMRARVDAFIAETYSTPMEQGRVRKALEKAYKWPTGIAPRWREVERLAEIPTARIRTSPATGEVSIAVPMEGASGGDRLRVEKDITSYGLAYFRWLRDRMVTDGP